MVVPIGLPSALAGTVLYQIRTGRGVSINRLMSVGLASPNTLNLRFHTPFNTDSGFVVATAGARTRLGWSA